MGPRSVAEALADFCARFRAAAEGAGAWPPLAEHDPEWPLRCAAGAPSNGSIPWTPTARTEPFEASRDLHPDLAVFFGTYWSCPVAALHRGEVVYLSFFENEERERRALADWTTCPEEPVVVAHFMDDRWVRVDRHTAHVQIEEPGREASVVAPSLAEWLDELEALAIW